MNPAVRRTWPILVLVSFNVAMLVTAVTAGSTLGVRAFVAWFVGDAILTLVALAATDL